MNSLNHFITSLNLSLFFFQEKVTLKSMLILSLIFSVLIDTDQVISYYLKKKKDDGELRSWLQEPLGFFLIITPLAYLISKNNQYYFPLILTIVASHIILDYLTIHQVQPLAPFSKKKKTVGIFQPWPKNGWEAKKTTGPSEMYWLGINMIILLILI